jgi:hypothetical protein
MVYCILQHPVGKSSAEPSDDREEIAEGICTSQRAPFVSGAVSYQCARPERPELPNCAVYVHLNRQGIYGAILEAPLARSRPHGGDLDDLPTAFAESSLAEVD